MRVTPIRFVRNIEAANKFYSTLGLNENAAATSGTWADLHGNGGQLGLHIAQAGTTHSDAGAVALHFSTDERLELTAERLRAAGYAPSDIMDETFGRFITVNDPEGYRIQVNEVDADLQNLSYEIRESAALK
ncbi:VOC family protein [Pseudarthrobacter sp. SSS035]|uniref:VOC family protein n=1 Tax=Pseudarthrobacter sp. SSS035 TaxID=2931399 RepID=UPI00200FE64E|nr:VOC family protein [Pseudarthrobacter sp. SSS035]